MPTTVHHELNVSSFQRAFSVDKTLFFLYNKVRRPSFLIEECPRNAVFASYLIRIVPNQEKIEPSLLWFYFQSPMYWQMISENQRGIGQPNVNGTILSGLDIDLPIMIKEQKVLTEEIESRFSVIDKVEEVIDRNFLKTEVLRRAILKSAFEGKLVN